MEDLPIYEIIVEYDDEETRMTRQSFVRNPAVGIKRFAFGDNAVRNLIFENNKSQQMFMGVSILADTPMYRKDEDGYEYYTIFTKDSIRKINNKLSMDGRGNEVSLYHDDSKIIEGIYLVETFMVEKGRVETPLFDVPDGSLISCYFVPDLNQYNELLNDENFNGFSIEIGAKVRRLFNTHETLSSKIEKIIQSNEIDSIKESKIKTLLGL